MFLWFVLLCGDSPICRLCSCLKDCSSFAALFLVHLPSPRFLPSECHVQGEPYAALFDYFTDRDELPLGLYRFHAYVLTNPRRDTVIHADDQVYVVTKSTEMMDRPNVHTFTAP